MPDLSGRIQKSLCWSVQLCQNIRCLDSVHILVILSHANKVNDIEPSCVQSNINYNTEHFTLTDQESLRSDYLWMKSVTKNT